MRLTHPSSSTRRGLALLAALQLPASTSAALALPSFWGSSMVLPRNHPLVLWGTDAPGSNVTVTYAGGKWPASAPAGADGRFEVALPAANASAVPQDVVVASSSGDTVTLSDVVVGDVFVCSGQSNMQLSVENTAEYAALEAAADGLGATLRVFQVDRGADYPDVTTPQDNLTASIPWARASNATIGGMSAFCYNFGAQAAAAKPDIPIGIQDTSWGGVAIQVWMSAAALAECPEAVRAPSLEHQLRIGTAPGATRRDAAYAVVAAAELAAMHQDGVTGSPVAGACLYNSMLHPLLSLPIAGILWYQGESNALDPIGYQCMQKAMVADWRASWAKVGADPDVPFLFAQLSAWPVGMDGSPLDEGLPDFRYAAQKTLTDLPKVGMVVAADIADPAGAYHPIHPPWKAELGRRAWLWADNVVYGNATSPPAGPRPVAVTWDPWDASWGDYHHGTGSNSYVCTSATWTCAGVRVTFDQPISLRRFYTADAPSATIGVYDFATGAASGFVLWAPANGSAPAWGQPAAISGLVDDRTVQLNTTWIGPGPLSPATGKPMPTLLKYAWTVYPQAMPVVNSFGLPAGPFNLTVPAAPPAA